MSISSGQELDQRIHNFLESKLKRFPEIANMSIEQQRSSSTIRNRANTEGWLPRDSRIAQ